MSTERSKNCAGLARSTRIFRGNAGMSLLEVLIAVGILGIVAVAFTKIFDNMNRGQKNIELKMDRHAIALSIGARVSCPDLESAGSPCTTSGKLVELKDRSNKTLISQSGSTFGSYTVRAECSPSKDGIILKAVRLTGDGDVNSSDPKFFRPDPLTGKIVKWSDSTSLMQPSGAYICPSSGTGSFEWVTLPCDAYESYGLGWNCVVTGNLNPEKFCKSQGFSTFSGTCRHDANAPHWVGGLSNFGGQGTIAAAVQVGGPYSGRWVVACMTRHWQIPDFIGCVK
jgi:prepilin-type N-terminal cleavage/methylation domain-containing protein